MNQDEEEEVAISPTEQAHEPMVVDPIELAIVNPPVIDVANASAANMEEDEDLLVDLGDLDKAISISFIVNDKSKGLPAHSELEIKSFPAKESLVVSTMPSLSVDPTVLTSLVHQVQELLSHQLEVLTTDEGLQQKLFYLLQ